MNSHANIRAGETEMGMLDWLFGRTAARESITEAREPKTIAEVNDELKPRPDQRYDNPDHRGVVFDRKDGKYKALTADEVAAAGLTLPPKPSQVNDNLQRRREPASHAEPPNFDDMMDDLAEIHGAKWISSKIAGVKYPNPDGSSRQERIRLLETADELTLVPDPGNEFSRHAVKVLDAAGYTLGFLPEPLCFAIEEALSSGGMAKAFVRHAKQVGTMPWGVAIGVLWKIQNSLRTEFRIMLDKLIGVQADEWFWVKLSGFNKVNPDGTHRQEIIAGLKPTQQLQVRVNGSLDNLAKATKVHLETDEGRIVATLSNQHATRVIASMRDGRRWGSMVFEVRERTAGDGLEPVVALILCNEEFSAQIRKMENEAG